MTLKSMGYPVDGFNWIPLLSFSFVIFIASLGVVSLPLLMFAEVVPDNVKDFSVTAYMTLNWLSASVLIKYLPMLIESLGFDVSMYLFAGVCMACELYIIFFVPETKGKSHEEIMVAIAGD